MAGSTASPSVTRLLLIDRSSQTPAHTHPNVKALLSEGWNIARIEPRITEGRGAQWLVALTHMPGIDAPRCKKRAVVGTG